MGKAGRLLGADSREFCGQGCSVVFELAFACEIGSTDCAKEHIGQKKHISLAIFQPERESGVDAGTAVLDGREENNLGQVKFVLLHMYNDLQKRYVRESKKSKEQSEAIKNLTIKIHELEHNLQEQRQRIEQLECKKVSWKTSAVSGKRSRTSEGGITSHRDISEEKESCCSKYLEVTGGAPMGEKETSASVLKAMILADTHLLGEIKGHWFDKLRREWQMERSFQTALWLLQPDIVFILGDVFDEGKWSSPQAWADDVRRFRKMFKYPVSTELVVIVGNHDIGFHYEMTTYKVNRFEKVFNLTSGKLITRKGVNFVLVNSVAMEGDGCAVCSTSEAKLVALSHKLNCSLQHYPLYRKSDAECSGEDAAPPEEKNTPFKEKYDVLSQEASQKV
ncbi:metallophosphoesterase 1 [Pitangus sulphuratus]|nr:metallophosphoesterase 1 [Pitangus sulphuratus]